MKLSRMRCPVLGKGADQRDSLDGNDERERDQKPSLITTDERRAGASERNGGATERGPRFN